MKHKLHFVAIVACLTGCAATSPNYNAPAIKGTEPAIVISGTRTSAGSGCLATIVIDGAVAGTVGAQETLVIPVKPGQYFVRWDIRDAGMCPSKEDLAHRLVTVGNGPILLKLEMNGMGKAFIPIVGMFTQPEYRILADDEDK